MGLNPLAVAVCLAMASFARFKHDPTAVSATERGCVCHRQACGQVLQMQRAAHCNVAKEQM